jgi:hypothetical protein
MTRTSGRAASSAASSPARSASHGAQVHSGQQVGHRRIPGILDRDPVARPQPGLQHPLHAVQCPADDRHVLRVDAVGQELLGRQVTQARQDRRVAVQPGRRCDGRQLRQQLRIGTPDEQVAGPGRRHERGPRPDRRRAGDPGPGPAVPPGDPLLTQLTVGRGHRDRAQAELAGQHAHRRQRHPRGHPALAHRVLHVARYLAGVLTLRPVLYQHK